MSPAAGLGTESERLKHESERLMIAGRSDSRYRSVRLIMWAVIDSNLGISRTNTPLASTSLTRFVQSTSDLRIHHMSHGIQCTDRSSPWREGARVCAAQKLGL